MHEPMGHPRRGVGDVSVPILASARRARKENSDSASAGGHARVPEMPKIPTVSKITKNDGTACEHPPNVPTGSKNQKDAHENFSETTV